MSRTRLSVAVPVLCLLALATLVGCAGGGPPPPVGPSSPVAMVDRPPPAEHRAAVVLREWDQRRARAYASGSVADLRALYAEDAPAGRRDVRLLRGYLDRGLVVLGLRVQVLALDVLRDAGPVLRVRVTDRVVGAEAMGPSGVLPLPRDSPSTRTVTMRESAGGWVVVSVSAAPR